MKRVLGITITIAGWALIAACTQKGGPVKVDSVEPRLIHTLRGVGYVLRTPS